MGPELQYQMMMTRAAELRDEAAHHRTVRAAIVALKERRASAHRARASFGKSRAS
ncbi:hypothetical protein [Microtetraspora niveoalba]|uniref:hypothetical protein n=1 Tax=Microtetraspora niveoalba TaxID=46175 RepID=UPI000ABEFA1D|nr:hypothetical protein [Microtetraspora niveoalba]